MVNSNCKKLLCIGNRPTVVSIVGLVYYVSI